MEFPHDMWIPLLVEARSRGPVAPTSAWWRFTRHALFDRQLFRCIERARCSLIAVNLTGRPFHIEQIGLLGKQSGFWLASASQWRIFPCWQWTANHQRLLHQNHREKPPSFWMQWYGHAFFDYGANPTRWVWLEVPSNAAALHVCVADGVSTLVNICPEDRHDVRGAIMTLDVAARRIFVVLSQVVYVLDADANVLQRIVCGFKRNVAPILALDSVRQLLYVRCQDRHGDDNLHAMSWDGCFQYKVVLRNCPRGNDLFHSIVETCMVVHSPSGWIAHMSQKYVCVHRPDGGFVREVIVNAYLGDINDACVNDHLDILCVGQENTVTILACSTVFAAP